MEGTSYRNYELLDSFANSKDSNRTSALVEYIDPYLLMYLKVDPVSLDTFFTQHWIEQGARNSYRSRFLQTFTKTQSKAYQTFKKMYEEDISLRAKRETAREYDLDTLLRRMEQSDSVHFDYLYNYVKKNGWPKLPEGSLFAADIALHDFAHYQYYFPVFQEAYKNGDLPLKDLKKMQKFSQTLNGFDTVKAVLGKRHMIFDMTCLLRLEPPSQQRIQLMLDSIQRHCPIGDVMIIAYARDRSSPAFKFGSDMHELPQRLRTRMHDFLFIKPKERCRAYRMEIISRIVITDVVNEKWVLYINY